MIYLRTGFETVEFCVSNEEYRHVSHLETLIAEYLEWQGFLIRRNTKVGRRERGGWEMELDVVGFNPISGRLVHYEPSLDALTWSARELRYKKKFDAAKKYMFTELFSWLPPSTVIEQIAIFYNHPSGRDDIAGARIVSVDELMAEIRAHVVACGPMIRNAIPEQYPLLRTIQLTHAGYRRPVNGTTQQEAPSKESCWRNVGVDAE